MRTKIRSYRLYGEESDESGDFWIHCETIAVRTHLHNWEIEQHRHDALFQIFCLTEGQGEISAETQIRRFAAPCAIFIPAAAPHGFRFSRDIDGLVLTAVSDRLRSISAADRQVSEFLTTIRIVPFAAGDDDCEYALACVARLHAELKSRRVGRLALLEPLMTGSVISLARAALSPSATQDAAMSPSRHVDSLLTLISAHFRRQRRVSFYAESVGASATHLNRVARAATGYSVQGLIALQVVEAARRDLVFTPTPVQSIAYSLGFSDPAYFNRFFRRHTGLTPGAFRHAERRKLSG